MSCFRRDVDELVCVRIGELAASRELRERAVPSITVEELLGAMPL